MRIQSAGEQPAVVISVEIKKITQKKEIQLGCGHHGNGPDIRRILRPDRVYDGVVVGQNSGPMLPMPVWQVWSSHP